MDKKVGLSTKGLTEEEIKILKKYPEFSSYPFLYLEEVRCSQRVIKEIERRFYDYKEPIFIELSPEDIIPGSKLGDVVEFLHFTKVLSYDRTLLWLGKPD